MQTTAIPRLTNEQLEFNNKIIQTRLILQKYFYNEEAINRLISIINSEIETFRINYEGNNIISMKVKKTGLKNIYDFSHNSTFYYKLLNDILFRWISDLLPTQTTATIPYEEYMILQEVICSNVNVIPNLYVITTMNDNIVVIYL